MSDILFTYEVIISLFISFILFITLSIAFINSIYILKNYKKGDSSQLQYQIEKKSYLVTTIIQISLLIKIALLPFFIFTIDKLSDIIPGAMCGAGVISANSYGEPLIILKIFIIIMTMLWLSVNRHDLNSKDFKYFKKKILFFIALFLLVTVEVVFEYKFFTGLTTVNPVSCCSSLYDTSSNSFVFNISMLKLVSSFYFVYFIIILSSYFQKRYLLALLSLLYIYLAYVNIVYFFSSYIYELPSHKCPYCLLQSEYYFIGYFIYTSIIMATYYPLIGLIFKDNIFKKSMFWYTVATLLISLNFIIYLIVNRTFL